MKMKKIPAAVLLLCLLAFAGCGKDGTDAGTEVRTEEQADTRESGEEAIRKPETEYTVTGDGEYRSRTYRYEEYGELTELKSYAEDGTVLSALFYSYTRDENGRISEMTETAPDGNTTYRYRYDENGRETGKTVLSGNAVTAEYEYAYDEYGNVTLERLKGPDGQLVSELFTEYTYDGDGRLLREQTRTGEAGGRISLLKYEYDEEDRLIRRFSGSLNDGEENWTSEDRLRYDENGFVSEVEYLIGGSLNRRIVYENDAWGNPVRTVSLDENGEVKSEVRTEYTVLP